MTTEAKKVDIFKVKKTAAPTKSNGTNVVHPDPAIAAAVDQYNKLNAEIKSLSGELTVTKNTLESYARREHANRIYIGNKDNFKIQGNETQVMWVAQNSSGGMGQDQYDEFSAKWGTSAAESLLKVDMSTVRFNVDVLEKNKDVIMAALQSIDPSILENLFTSPTYKVTETIIANLSEHTKSAAEVEDLARDLKIKAYVKQG